MSTYTKSTSFTPKDSYASGDPRKIIKGEEFDDEFNNIEIAINDNAADIASLEAFRDENLFSFAPFETTLYVDPVAQDEGGFFFRNKVSPTTGTGHALEVTHHNGSYDGSYFVVFKYSNTVWGGIVRSGSSVAYNTSSDYRLKENVVPVDNAADRVKELKPCRFNFTGSENTVDGFIAHEAQQVVPESVTGDKDAVDAEGNPVYQGIDQSKLVPLLTAALQEALARIEALEGVA